MWDRTKTKYNRSSSAEKGGCFRNNLFLFGVVCVLLVVGAGGRAFAIAPVGQSEQQDDLRPQQDWMQELWYWLHLWSSLSTCGEPQGDDPVAWLNSFNECWLAVGLPEILTNTDRDAMLSALDGIETALLREPDRVDSAVLERSKQTIREAREALRRPIPEPAPDPSLQEVQAATIGGGA